VAALVAGIMLAQMLALIGWNAGLAVGAPAVDAARAAGLSNTEWLGTALFTDYILPFEIAAVILTVAIIAAIALTLRHRPGIKRQDPSRQVLVRKEDRLRVIKMPPSGPEGSP
jgi:NADH-quinone oxidoreductase subunit J